MIGVLARRDAAEIDLAEPGRGGLDRNRRQEFDEVLEFLDLQLVEPFGADRGDRERHVLQILFALRRGDHDVAVVVGVGLLCERGPRRSEEHTSELQSLMRISYAVFCLNKKKKYEETR